MKTLKISKEEMLKRVSVFKDLKPLPIQLDKNIPQEGKDIVYARELLSIIGLENNSHNTPINKNAPITGAAGITMTIAKCPPNQGPGGIEIVSNSFNIISSDPSSFQAIKNLPFKTVKVSKVA